MPRQMMTTLFGIPFKNPIWIGSCDATAIASMEDAIASGAGAVVMKSITELADFRQQGMTRFMVMDEKGRPLRGKPAGSYTFFSRGGPMQSVEEVLKHLPAWKQQAGKRDVRIIGSVSAGTMEGWEQISVRLAEAGVDALELNFGNPHARHSNHSIMGEKISRSTEAASLVVRTVAKKVNIPILVKLSGNSADFEGLALAVLGEGASGITVMHRAQGLMIDVETGIPVMGGYNGVGGPWMKPLTLHALSRVYNAVGCTVIGSNGVDSWEDACEFMLAGASAVQVASGVMVRGFGFIQDLLSGVEAYLQRKEVLGGVSAITGMGARHLLKKDSLVFEKGNSDRRFDYQESWPW